MSHYGALLKSAELSLKRLDETRAKIDAGLNTLHPKEVSDAIESIDEALRSIVKAMHELTGVVTMNTRFK